MSTIIPIVLPDLGSGDVEIRVSLWFVKAGESVDAGDQVVEVQLPGMTFDVCSPASGRMTRIEKPISTRVESGDVLGWLAT
jgi:pyruvate/2-oxoglutarate dehydrogenase complex dihydrolipoamide acyltransferase (E2) component